MMPRYHFNIYNAIGFVPDEEGRDLPGLEAARVEALKGARAMIADDVLQGRLDLQGRLEVLDEAGKLLFTLPFNETVDVSP